MRIFRLRLRAPGLLVPAFLLSARLLNAQPPPALRPPHGEIAPTVWERYGWAIIIIVAAIIVVAGAVFVLLAHQRPKLQEPPEVLARRGLAALRGRAVDGPLLMDISRIFRRYLIFAFGLSSQEPTTAELSETLETSANADPALVSSIVKFLRECDEDKFSPGTSPPHTDPATRALVLLDRIEAHRRRSLPQMAAT